MIRLRPVEGIDRCARAVESVCAITKQLEVKLSEGVDGPTRHPALVAGELEQAVDDRCLLGDVEARLAESARGGAPVGPGGAIGSAAAAAGHRPDPSRGLAG